MNCASCGKTLNPNQRFCNGCGTPVAAAPTFSPTESYDPFPAAEFKQTGSIFQNSGYAQPDERVAIDSVTTDDNQVLNANDNSSVKEEEQTIRGVKMANEEFTVRSYMCSYLTFPSCTGYLSVTNRRVLFHGLGFSDFGVSSRIVNEVPLDAVSGMSTYYGGKILIWRLLAGILMVIIGFGILIANYSSSSSRGGSWGSPSSSSPDGIEWLIIITLWVIGGALLATCYRKTFVLKVFSSKANASPIHIGEGAGGIVGSSAMFSITAKPTEQTDKMMLELGAMISDLQNMGDYGVARWKEE